MWVVFLYIYIYIFRCQVWTSDSLFKFSPYQTNNILNIMFPFSQRFMLLVEVSEIAVDILIHRDILFLETNTKEMRLFLVIFNVSFLISSWQIIHAQWTNRWHFVHCLPLRFSTTVAMHYIFSSSNTWWRKRPFSPKNLYNCDTICCCCCSKNVLIGHFLFLKKISSSERNLYLQKPRKEIDEFLKVICSLADQLVSGREILPFFCTGVA